MTSANTFPKQLTEIDALTLADHWYLTPEDACYFLGEYTARKGFSFSATNSLILNFKKSVERRGRPEWQHKERAIAQAAAAFSASISAAWLRQATLIPVPPSKAKTDKLYDDRMVRMLRAIRPSPPLDIRELVLQTASTEAAHDADQRPRPEDIERLYTVNSAAKKPPPTLVGIFDDVLTTGAHFKAVKAVVARTFPSVPVVGFFIARRAPETANFEDFDNLDDLA